MSPRDVKVQVDEASSVRKERDTFFSVRKERDTAVADRAILKDNVRNLQAQLTACQGELTAAQKKAEELRDSNDNLAAANLRQGDTIAELKRDVDTSTMNLRDKNMVINEISRIVRGPVDIPLVERVRELVVHRDVLKKGDEQFRSDLTKAFGFYGGGIRNEDAIISEAKALTANLVEYQGHATRILSILGISILDAAPVSIEKLKAKTEEQHTAFLGALSTLSTFRESIAKALHTDPRTGTDDLVDLAKGRYEHLVFRGDRAKRYLDEVQRLRTAIDAFDNNNHKFGRVDFWDAIRKGAAVDGEIVHFDFDEGHAPKKFTWNPVGSPTGE